VLLELDAEPVGDAVDVVEVRHHLVRVDDVALGQPSREQRLDVLPRHARRAQGEHDGVAVQRAQSRREGLDVVGDDRLQELGAAGLPTQRLAVVDLSIEAVVDP
jgi:hypothetical protein